MRVPNQRRRNLQEGRLAGPVSSEQRQELTALHVQRHPGQRREVSECFADVVRFECEHRKALCAKPLRRGLRLPRFCAIALSA